MKQETLEKLQDADDSVEWERPIDVNWDDAMSRVEKLKLEVEKLVGRAFEIDKGVQDASFMTDLFLCRPGNKTNYIDTVLAIRFSNFGSLFTLWSHCSSEKLAPDVTARIIKLAESYKFIYIEADELKEEYTGQHQGFKKSSWWIRFFDYV